LIDDLLDVSRIAMGKVKLKRTTLDVREVITRASDSVGPLMASKNHDLRVTLPAGPLSAFADAARLEQVVSNLLTNAAKFTDNGGTIAVAGSLEGTNVVIRVQDNGVGIAPEMLTQIFGLFTQVDHSLDRSQGGLGIGLKLVKSLVKMHGGSVEVASDGAGNGTEFTVRVPSKPRTGVTPEEKGPADPPETASARRSRVLVVDDNHDIATGMARLIETVGHEVQIAHDGPSALKMAREFRPEYILMDIGLPGMTGYEVAQRLRKDPRVRSATLIAFSGYGQVQDRSHSRAAGFDYHLLKPAEASTLLPLLAAPATRKAPEEGP
jgi:CheY-like chemotaxis protein/two-component sensor histidine kinase